MRRQVLSLLAMTLLAATSGLAADNEAKGTIIYKSRTTTVKYAYLVKGPDAITKQPIRRLILSSADLGAKIAACRSTSTAAGDSATGWCRTTSSCSTPAPSRSHPSL